MYGACVDIDKGAFWLLSLPGHFWLGDSLRTDLVAKVCTQASLEKARCF